MNMQLQSPSLPRVLPGRSSVGAKARLKTKTASTSKGQFLWICADTCLLLLALGWAALA